ncbi:MAG: RND transporter [Rhizobiales bacterium 32-66-8]|nr:MAG: RND transporter [Rhizobiales bacterium 32-66-8]
MRVLAAGLTFMMCACAVGPDYQTPSLALPATWGSDKPASPARADRPSPNLSHWWLRLRDPTLNTLMDAAVAGNLDVATARAKIRQARASYRQTVGALLPSISGSASMTRGDDGSNVSSGGDLTVAGPYSQYQAGFDASWELDLFGANRRAAEAANYGVQAAEDDLRATLLTLVGDIASNYVAARGYQARIALARRTAASQRETAALTERRLNAGAASALDVANANGQAAGTEANIPELESALAQSVHRLSVLTGQPPAALVSQMQRPEAIPTPRLPLPASIPADVLVTRPDVRRAERQLAQSTALIGEAEAARYPSISVTGALTTNGTKLGDLAKGSSISALAQERVRSSKLTASAAAYRDAARLSRALYQSGSTSFLDVLDAERSLYSAEDSLLQSRVAIATNYVALNKALGGGWDGVIDTATPAVVDTNTGPHFATAP